MLVALREWTNVGKGTATSVPEAALAAEAAWFAYQGSASRLAPNEVAASSGRCASSSRNGCELGPSNAFSGARPPRPRDGGVWLSQTLSSAGQRHLELRQQHRTAPAGSPGGEASAAIDECCAAATGPRTSRQLAKAFPNRLWQLTVRLQTGQFELRNSPAVVAA